jgi:hypothetical protein
VTGTAVGLEDGQAPLRAGTSEACSVLFDRPPPEGQLSPDALVDLHLDQVFEAVTAGRQSYDLASFFLRPLADEEAVRYRQDAFRDLHQSQVLEVVRSFAASMRTVREHHVRATKARHAYQEQAWFLHGVRTYCAAVDQLRLGLHAHGLGSRAFRSVRDYLDDYTAGEEFTRLVSEADDVARRLSEVTYTIKIGPSWVTVDRYADEPDYSRVVLDSFDRFRQEEARDHRVPMRTTSFMTHIEEAILDRVARLFPETFAALGGFRGRHADYLDGSVLRFDRDVQFYVAYLEFVEPLQRAGLPLCFPEVSASKEISATDTYDVALAAAVATRGEGVVLNDVELAHDERILLVSGPNQGGKTTFARTLGQLHHLAALGCPVPGRSARLHLCDTVLTHFEREEHAQDLRGKLEDDLVRVHRILQEATTNSLVILNEVFSSTALEDALYLSRLVLQRVVDLDLLCVCVTFVDELATMSPTIVSMVAEVDPDDPTTRTYRLVRRPADGLAYATAIARKHGLTYDQLRGRLAR